MAADDADRLVDLGPPAGVHAVDVALDLADEVPDPADFLCCGHRVGTGPLIDPVDAGGQPLAGAQQVVEIAGQVRKVGDVRKWSQPAQRNRIGQAPPPAWTLAGWVQVP